MLHTARERRVDLHDRAVSALHADPVNELGGDQGAVSLIWHDRLSTSSFTAIRGVPGEHKRPQDQAAVGCVAIHGPIIFARPVRHRAYVFSSAQAPCASRSAAPDRELPQPIRRTPREPCDLAVNPLHLANGYTR